ncbi:MAG: ABC transporter substrate-binding protein [Firmicutes bacterium]|nr:ABC transporter substrate-binding protein [Bacillota bacterium]
MARTKKALVLLLAVLLLLLPFVSCAGRKTDNSNGNTNTNNTNSGNVAEEPDDSERTLRIQAMQDSGTLYPLGVTGGFVSPLYAFYEPLYDTRADGSRRWVLATGLERITDLNYTLTIREGITFSNGNPLTAEDVMFSMELCRDNPQFSLNVKVVDFEKTKVIDDYTIDLWYTEYNASQEPGFASMFVLDKESFDEVALSRNPIGTGPYVVTDYVVNSHLRVKARDDYWGEKPRIKNIEFRIINEDAQIINALETGALDLSRVPILEADYVESLGYNIRISNGRYNYVTLFSMLPDSPLGSKEARWAVCHAIDREAIIDFVYEGKSTITDYPASHFLADFEPRFRNLHETYSIGYNPERARELAEQSGLVGKKLRIINNGSSDAVTISEILQENLLAIGVESEIINFDQATYFGTMMDANNFEIAIFTPSAPSMLAVDILAMYLTFIPLGWTGPERDHYGQLSMGALTTYDPASRQEQLFEVIKYFVDFCPWYGLCEVVSTLAIAPDLKGVEYMIAGSIYYQDMYWE